MRNEFCEKLSDDASVFAAQFRLRLTKLQNTLRPFRKIVTPRRIDTKYGGDYARWNLLRIFRRSIALTLIDDTIDQLMAKVFGEFTIAFRRLRGKKGQDKLFVGLMQRRIRGNRRVLGTVFLSFGDQFLTQFRRWWDNGDRPRGQFRHHADHLLDIFVLGRHPGTAPTGGVRYRTPLA